MGEINVQILEESLRSAVSRSLCLVPIYDEQAAVFVTTKDHGQTFSVFTKDPSYLLNENEILVSKYDVTSIGTGDVGTFIKERLDGKKWNALEVEAFTNLEQFLKETDYVSKGIEFYLEECFENKYTLEDIMNIIIEGSSFEYLSEEDRDKLANAYIEEYIDLSGTDEVSQVKEKLEIHLEHHSC